MSLALGHPMRTPVQTLYDVTGFALGMFRPDGGVPVLSGGLDELRICHPWTIGRAFPGANEFFFGAVLAVVVSYLP